MTHLVVALKTNKGGKVAIAYIAAAERHEPVENAESLATIVASIVDRKMHMINGRNGIVAFGLHSVSARVHVCVRAWFPCLSFSFSFSITFAFAFAFACSDDHSSSLVMICAADVNMRRTFEFCDIMYAPRAI